MTIGGGPSSNKIQSGNANTSPTLTNQDNTISGDGTIGIGLNFINDGIVETNNSTSSNPGTLAILGTSGIFISNSGNFVNNNVVRADSGGTVILGVDGVTGSIDNEANIDIDANTFTATALKIAGNMTISATGGGSINLEGADAETADEIVSDGNPATLTLIKQTITGAGFIGDFDLTLDNQSGTIEAANGELFLYSLGEGPTIINAGTLESSSSGTIVIEQNVNNSGTISANGGLMFIDGNVTGSGSIDIGTGGGFGPMGGPGTSDMLMRNTTTGAFEVYDIVNNQIAAAASIGQAGTTWSVAGIGGEPSGGSSPANAQLVQAMASFTSITAADNIEQPMIGASDPAAQQVIAVPHG